MLSPSAGASKIALFFRIVGNGSIRSPDAFGVRNDKSPDRARKRRLAANVANFFRRVAARNRSDAVFVPPSPPRRGKFGQTDAARLLNVLL